MHDDAAALSCSARSLFFCTFSRARCIVSMTNPLKEWIEEMKIDPNVKSYIGYTPAKSNLDFLINLVRDKGTLYPSYLIYCMKRSIRPISHVKFSTELEMACKALCIDIWKGRDRYGNFIQGLGVNRNITLDDFLGSPPQAQKSPKLDTAASNNTLTLCLEEKAQNEPSLSRPSVFSTESNSLRWETRNPELYFQYIEALGKTPFKQELNKLSKQFKPDPKELLHNHADLLSGLKGIKVPGLEDIDFGKPSPEYLRDVQTQIEKGILKAQKIVPFKYKQMGMSPRILPQSYGESINSVKKFVRQVVSRLRSWHNDDVSIVIMPNKF
eukprot:jgi/Ulvmu1/6536/UM003_0170.1